jgi:hypothetical protein
MTLCIILFVIIIVLLILIYYKKQEVEYFHNNNDDNYLYPVRDLQEICKKDYNLYPAFGAELCMNGDKPNPYANCKCVDKAGDCKVCYDTEKKFEQGANVVYDSTGK